MGRHRSGNKRRDNTLATVITAMVIIAFMAGMLLPALSVSRSKARQITCASNLKSIGLALRMYSSDYNGYFPPQDGAAGLEVLRSQGYLENVKMYQCPSVGSRGSGSSGLCSSSSRDYDEPLTEELVDYHYRGGLTEADSVTEILAWDKAENHEHYGNALSLDGHVTGFAGKKWLEKARRSGDD